MLFACLGMRLLCVQAYRQRMRSSLQIASASSQHQAASSENRYSSPPNDRPARITHLRHSHRLHRHPPSPHRHAVLKIALLASRWVFFRVFQAAMSYHHHHHHLHHRLLRHRHHRSRLSERLLRRQHHRSRHPLRHLHRRLLRLPHPPHQRVPRRPSGGPDPIRPQERAQEHQPSPRPRRQHRHRRPQLVGQDHHHL
jgi:hypothetical protein